MNIKRHFLLSLLTIKKNKLARKITLCIFHNVLSSLTRRKSALSRKQTSANQYLNNITICLLSMIGLSSLVEFAVHFVDNRFNRVDAVTHPYAISIYSSSMI